MTPKLFISYSWSGQDYENRVLEIATQLRESGVDVILDKWDLQEGHDSTAFMEKMISDPEIKKVAIFCDRIYKEKADGRLGGVGTETQIISSNVYASQQQSKFVAVVMERDDDGKAYLPIYYASRIYIDLSDPATFTAEFEKLLRWVFDKRLNQKPGIGKMPEFLASGRQQQRLAVSVQYRRAIDAVRNGRQNAVPAVKEFFDAVATEFEKVRIRGEEHEIFDDAVWQSIEDFLPYRDEIVSLISDLALYRPELESARQIHRFIEKLIPYLDRPANVNSWQDWDFDNFAFLVHELYLYTIAIALRNERFDWIGTLTADFYQPSERRSNEMVSYCTINRHLRSFETRNRRLGLNRASLHADLLTQRCNGSIIRLHDLMQADFVLYIKNVLKQCDELWYPESLFYVGSSPAAFEVFARARSAAYFSQMKLALGITDRKALTDLAEDFRTQKLEVPRWTYRRLDPARLMGVEIIATQP
ncbi:TIR domain-containing protein [Rhizobium sp. NLR10a]|uniref:TIR domain-containing protein n=1 Tax=unclassified Rhizobium TaxID=2613769 RepID=UPI001C837B92|nr:MULTISPECIES: TIR domain-containing protein [unclassified Rhizobium]MBX5213957.1 TIR domain-containing protein [Rhizobium sp. NLR9a]MBX5218894.1 TIR domain-containing protein [Rhizobium sp. NLR8a]MBX5275346.1 TIR domain-containing protein [Rhizobium sp. NLR13a]MBX5281133.1 TIR domain-containing protein [Rhizobium sp. NLR10a]MBX5295444.1 TIR domain-containing protein [Rhizobium sp. NLR15a]